MKRNINKLAVLMIVVALALFMAVPTAKAWWPFHNTLWGKYAFTGVGNCLIQPPGADPFLSPLIANGVYTFDGHGSGTLQYVARFVDYPPGVIAVGKEAWEFKYKRTDQAQCFTEYFEAGTYPRLDWIAGPNSGSTNYFDVNGSCDIVVSLTGDTVNITCGHQDILTLTLCNPGEPPCSPIPFTASCSWSHVGTRVGE
jgi:hypothetical protein